MRTPHAASPALAPEPAAAARPAGSPPLGLYLHIPFSRTRCRYCDFYRVGMNPVRLTAFLDALHREIDGWEALHGHSVDTIFLGGGTPSLLAPGQLAHRPLRQFPGVGALHRLARRLEVAQVQVCPRVLGDGVGLVQRIVEVEQLDLVLVLLHLSRELLRREDQLLMEPPRRQRAGLRAPPRLEELARALEGDSAANVLSTPTVLTLDNEEAEIRVGNNIPIISSRVQSAAGVDTEGLASSVNVERQDIGVTLRVTPQITEGDSLRLEIFQEITEINDALSTSTGGVGDPEEVGVAL